jgi:hypothetical protein
MSLYQCSLRVVCPLEISGLYLKKNRVYSICLGWQFLLTHPSHLLCWQCRRFPLTAVIGDQAKRGMWFGGLPWTLNELVSAETIAVDRSVGEDGYHKLTLQGRAFARRPGTRRARARLHSDGKLGVVDRGGRARDEHGHGSTRITRTSPHQRSSFTWPPSKSSRTRFEAFNLVRAQ